MSSEICWAGSFDACLLQFKLYFLKYISASGHNLKYIFQTKRRIYCHFDLDSMIQVTVSSWRLSVYAQKIFKPILTLPGYVMIIWEHVGKKCRHLDLSLNYNIIISGLQTVFKEQRLWNYNDWVWKLTCPFHD